MAKSFKAQVLLPKELHEKAIKASQEMFGETNISGFMKTLVKNYKLKSDVKK